MSFVGISSLRPRSCSWGVCGFFLFVSVLFGGSFARSGAESLDQLLRDWITKNIYFAKDGQSRDTLFIRTRPVRAYVKSDDPDVVAQARSTIGNLAHAFGLEHSFAETRINMFVATATGIADGDKPNRATLNSLGLPPSAINQIIADSNGWSTGCGLYDSRGDDGRLSVSIVVGDKSLSPRKLKSCIASGIVFSYGLRVAAKETFEDSNDYIQFLILARALGDCDKRIASQAANTTRRVADVYVECALGKLKAKLSD